MPEYNHTSESGNAGKPTREEAALILAAEQVIRRNHVNSLVMLERIKLENRERAMYRGEFAGVAERDRNGFPAASFDQHIFDASEGRR